MTKRFNLFLLAMLVIVGLPAYWLLIDNQAGNAPAKPVEIAELRRLAASLPGQAPERVEVEIVASRNLPRTVFAAGTGLRLQRIVVMAFRLPVRGGEPIVIDTGMSRPQAKAIGMSHYDPAAQARVNAALAEAGLILVTHEHADHMGGLAALADKPAIMRNALLNPAQADDAKVKDAAPWPPGNRPAASLAATGLQAVAPGVVVIPAPSHTPGSQMIYVRLADGREYLFTGDISSLAINWQELRQRSRLLSEHLSPSDRQEVHAWLRTIRMLHRQAPEMIIVPGHDYQPLAVFHAKARAESGFGNLEQRTGQ